MITLIMKNLSSCGKSATLLLVMLLATPSLYALDYPEAGDFAKGSKAWSENCARCHNMRSPSDLRDDQWVTTMFHMRVRAGLTGQETRDILTFLQGSNARVERSEIVKVSATTSQSTNISGKQIYEGNCLACHGANGKGTLPGVPDLTDKNGRLSKDESDLLNNIISGIQSPGSPMPMPPKGGNSSLSEDELNAVLKYMKETFYK